MCTKLDTRKGVHHSLADDEGARREFALEHGGTSLADVASKEHEQPARLGRPDLNFLGQWCERRSEILSRKEARKLLR